MGLRSRFVVVVASLVGAYAVMHRLGSVSGSTPAERAATLPGDELIVRPSLVTNHAATLSAPPEQVWPWLTQVGWHRGGWYTPRWVDRLLFPDNLPSTDRLDPDLVRDLRPGDRIPDGPPGTAVSGPSWLLSSPVGRKLSARECAGRARRAARRPGS